MDHSEKSVEAYLEYCGYQVVHEPNGNAFPDFLVDGSIAVEVRRLNQHDETEDRPKDLDETTIPLRQRITKLAQSLGPPTKGESWHVTFNFSRPVGDWKVLKRQILAKLSTFRDGAVHIDSEWSLGQRFSLGVFRASKEFPTFFLSAMPSDLDSGGWVLPELERNIRICVRAKTPTMEKTRSRYSAVWLILVDYIGFSLDDFDRETFSQQMSIFHTWDRLILLNPHNHTRAFEITSSTHTSTSHLER